MWSRLSGRSSDKPEASSSSRLQDDDTVSMKSGRRRVHRSEKSVAGDDDGRESKKKSSHHSTKSSSRGDDRSRGVDDSFSEPNTNGRSRTESVAHKSNKSRDKDRNGDDDKDRKRSSRTERTTDASDKSSRKERERMNGDRDNDEYGLIRRSTDPSGYRGEPQERSRAAFDAPSSGGPGFGQFPGQFSSEMPGMPGGFHRTDSDPTSRHGFSHVPQQFPGQFPSETASPYRPPQASHEGGPGLATEYYNDQGESVHHQPGARPGTPIISGTQPHLMAAGEASNPPPEPSSTGGVGAAAEFYGGADLGSTPSRPSKPGKQSKPGKTSSSNTPSKPSKTSSSSAGALGAAAAASTAAGYFMSGANPAPSTPQQNHLSTAQDASARMSPDRPSGYHATNGATQSSYNQGTSSSHTNAPYYAAAAAAGAAGFAAYEHHQHSQHQHSTSQYGISDEYSKPPPGFHYASDHNHGGHASASGGYGNGYGNANGNGYDGGYGGGGATGTSQQHKHKGPITRLVDFFRDPEGVAQFEEYTEYIGVCRYCFDPRTSARDAPRKHYYGRSRKSWERMNRSGESLHSRRSFEKINGSRTSIDRVDKTSRYSSDRKTTRRESDYESDRKKSGFFKGAATAAAAGIIGKKLLEKNNDFQDTYSVKSGRAQEELRERRRRSSSSERDRKGRSVSYGVTSDSRKSERKEYERRESKGEIIGVGRDGKPIRRPSVKNDSASEKRRRSKERDTDRKSNGFVDAAIGTAIGAGVAAAATSSMRRRSSSPTSKVSGVKRIEKRRDSSVSSASSRSRRRRKSSSRPGFLGGLFGSSASKNNTRSSGSKKRKQKESGFFGLSNASYSSTDSALVFDDDRRERRTDKKSVKDKRRRDRSESPRIKSDSDARKAVLALGAGMAALEAAKASKSGYSSDRADKRNAAFTGKHQIYEPTSGQHRPAHNPDDDVWEDASDDDSDSVDSNLAFGTEDRLHRKKSKDSISDASSVSEKWSWRWGGKEKRSPSPKLRPRQHSHTPPGAGRHTVGTVAAAAALTGLAGYEYQKHKQSGSKPVSYNSSTSQVPLREVEPRPVSESTFSEPRLHARPGPVPIQQPQPVSPVKRDLYNVQGMPGEFPADDHRGATAREQGWVGAGRATRSNSSPPPQIGDLDGRSSKRNSRGPEEMRLVQFKFDQEQQDRHDREEEEELRKSGIDGVEYMPGDGSKTKRKKVTKEEKELRQLQREEKAARKEDASSSRIADLEREIEETNKRLAALRDGSDGEPEPRRITGDTESEKRSSGGYSAAPIVAAGAAAIAGGLVGKALSERGQDQKSETQDGRRERRKRERSNSKPDSRGNYDDSYKYESRDYRDDRESRTRRTDHDVYSQGYPDDRKYDSRDEPTSDTRDRRGDIDLTREELASAGLSRITKNVADKVRLQSKSPVPVEHSSYAEFFAPTEKTSKPAGYKEQSTDPDGDNDITVYNAQVPDIVTVEPHGSDIKRSISPFSFAPDALFHVDTSKMDLPWQVPPLKIIRPTPMASPRMDPVDRASKTEPTENKTYEPEQEREPSRPKSKVSFGDNQTHSYESRTPEHEHDDWVRDAAVVGAAAIATTGAAAYATNSRNKEKSRDTANKDERGTSAYPSPQSTEPEARADDDEWGVRVSSKKTNKGKKSKRSSKFIEDEVVAEPPSAPEVRPMPANDNKAVDEELSRDDIEREEREWQRRHVPGGFGDDTEFAATLAAGLEDSGFDPDIVIKDAKFHQRESPPGSGDEYNLRSKSQSQSKSRDTSFERRRPSPVEQVLGFRSDSPGTEGAPPVQGYVESESVPATPADELKRSLSRQNTLDRDELQRSPGSNSKSSSTIEDRTRKTDVAAEDWPENVDESKLTKKEKKKLEKERAKKRESLQNEKLLEDEPASTNREVPFDAREPEFTEPQADNAEDEFAGLSKKERKKREQEKRRSLQADAELEQPIPVEVPANEPQAPEPSNEEAEWANLSKKERKKLEKEKRRSMTAEMELEPEQKPEETLPVVESVPDKPAEEEWGLGLSKKERKRLEKEKRQSMTVEPEPDQTARDIEQGAAEPDAPADSWDEPGLGKKERKKRDKERLAEAAVAAGATIAAGSAFVDSPTTYGPQESREDKNNEDELAGLSKKERKKLEKKRASQSQETMRPEDTIRMVKDDQDNDQDELDIINAAAREPEDAGEWSTQDSKSKKPGRKSTKELWDKAISHNDDEMDFINEFTDDKSGKPTRGLSDVVLEAARSNRAKELQEEKARDTPSPPQSRDEFFDAEAEAGEDIPTPTRNRSKSRDRASTPSAAGVPLPNEAGVPLPNESGASTPTFERMARSQELPARDDDNESVISRAKTTIGTGEDRERHKKKKHRSSRHLDDDDDTRSVVSSFSSPGGRSKDKDTPKEEKKGGIFGLFSRKNKDEEKRRKEQEEKEAAEAEEQERTKERKKKHRRSGTSTYGSGDEDSRSVSRGHRSRSTYGSDEDKKSRRSASRESKHHHHHHHHHSTSRSRHRGESGDRDRRDLPAERSDGFDSQATIRQVHDDGPWTSNSRDKAEEDQSFLGERPEKTKPPDISEHKDATERGLGGLEIVAGAALAAAALPAIEKELIGRADEGTPRDVSAQDERALPVTAPASPTKTPKHKSNLSVVSDGGRNGASSPTAVPLLFRRPPGSRTNSTSSTPAKAPSAPTTPGKNKDRRPGSTEFKGKADFRPLYLVERHHKPDTRFDPEEELPTLPSSKSTSRASSVHEEDSPKHEAFESPSKKFQGPPLDVDAAQRFEPSDVLDADQPTPTIASVKADRAKKEQDHLDAAMQEHMAGELEWLQRRRKGSVLKAGDHNPNSMTTDEELSRGEAVQLVGMTEPAVEHPRSGSPSSMVATHHEDKPKVHDSFFIPPFQAKQGPAIESQNAGTDRDNTARDTLIAAGLGAAAVAGGTAYLATRDQNKHESPLSPVVEESKYRSSDRKPEEGHHDSSENIHKEPEVSQNPENDSAREISMLPAEPFLPLVEEPKDHRPATELTAQDERAAESKTQDELQADQVVDQHFLPLSADNEPSQNVDMPQEPASSQKLISSANDDDVWADATAIQDDSPTASAAKQEGESALDKSENVVALPAAQDQQSKELQSEAPLKAATQTSVPEADAGDDWAEATPQSKKKKKEKKGEGKKSADISEESTPQDSPQITKDAPKTFVEPEQQLPAMPEQAADGQEKTEDRAMEISAEQVNTTDAETTETAEPAPMIPDVEADKEDAEIASKSSKKKKKKKKDKQASISSAATEELTQETSDFAAESAEKIPQAEQSSDGQSVIEETGAPREVSAEDPTADLALEAAAAGAEASALAPAVEENAEDDGVAPKTNKKDKKKKKGKKVSETSGISEASKKEPAETLEKTVEPVQEQLPADGAAAEDQGAEREPKTDISTSTGQSTTQEGTDATAEPATIQDEVPARAADEADQWAEPSRKGKEGKKNKNSSNFEKLVEPTENSKSIPADAPVNVETVPEAVKPSDELAAETSQIDADPVTEELDTTKPSKNSKKKKRKSKSGSVSEPIEEQVAEPAKAVTETEPEEGKQVPGLGERLPETHAGDSLPTEVPLPDSEDVDLQDQFQESLEKQLESEANPDKQGPSFAAAAEDFTPEQHQHESVPSSSATELPRDVSGEGAQAEDGTLLPSEDAELAKTAAQPEAEEGLDQPTGGKNNKGKGKKKKKSKKSNRNSTTLSDENILAADSEPSDLPLPTGEDPELNESFEESLNVQPENEIASAEANRSDEPVSREVSDSAFEESRREPLSEEVLNNSSAPTSTELPSEDSKPGESEGISAIVPELAAASALGVASLADQGPSASETPTQATVEDKDRLEAIETTNVPEAEETVPTFDSKTSKRNRKKKRGSVAETESTYEQPETVKTEASSYEDSPKELETEQKSIDDSTDQAVADETKIGENAEGLRTASADAQDADLGADEGASVGTSKKSKKKNGKGKNKSDASVLPQKTAENTSEEQKDVSANVDDATTQQSEIVDRSNDETSLPVKETLPEAPAVEETEAIPDAETAEASPVGDEWASLPAKKTKKGKNNKYSSVIEDQTSVEESEVSKEVASSEITQASSIENGSSEPLTEEAQEPAGNDDDWTAGSSDSKKAKKNKKKKARAAVDTETSEQEGVSQPSGNDDLNAREITSGADTATTGSPDLEPVPKTADDGTEIATESIIAPSLSRRSSKRKKRVSWPAEHELVIEHEISAPPSGIATPAELNLTIPEAIKEIPPGTTSDQISSPSWDTSPTEIRDEEAAFEGFGKKQRRGSQADSETDGSALERGIATPESPAVEDEDLWGSSGFGKQGKKDKTGKKAKKTNATDALGISSSSPEEPRDVDMAEAEDARSDAMTSESTRPEESQNASVTDPENTTSEAVVAETMTSENGPGDDRGFVAPTSKKRKKNNKKNRGSASSIETSDFPPTVPDGSKDEPMTDALDPDVPSAEIGPAEQPDVSMLDADPQGGSGRAAATDVEDDKSKLGFDPEVTATIGSQIAEPEKTDSAVEPDQQGVLPVDIVSTTTPEEQQADVATENKLDLTSTSKKKKGKENKGKNTPEPEINEPEVGSAETADCSLVESGELIEPSTTATEDNVKESNAQVASNDELVPEPEDEWDTTSSKKPRKAKKSKNNKVGEEGDKEDVTMADTVAEPARDSFVEPEPVPPGVQDPKLTEEPSTVEALPDDPASDSPADHVMKDEPATPADDGPADEWGITTSKKTKKQKKKNNRNRQSIEPEVQAGPEESTSAETGDVTETQQAAAIAGEPATPAADPGEDTWGLSGTKKSKKSRKSNGKEIEEVEAPTGVPEPGEAVEDPAIETQVESTTESATLDAQADDFQPLTTEAEDEKSSSKSKKTKKKKKDKKGKDVEPEVETEPEPGSATTEPSEEMNLARAADQDAEPTKDVQLDATVDEPVSNQPEAPVADDRDVPAKKEKKGKKNRKNKSLSEPAKTDAMKEPVFSQPNPNEPSNNSNFEKSATTVPDNDENFTAPSHQENEGQTIEDTASANVTSSAEPIYFDEPTKLVEQKAQDDAPVSTEALDESTLHSSNRDIPKEAAEKHSTNNTGAALAALAGAGAAAAATGALSSAEQEWDGAPKKLSKKDRKRQKKQLESQVLETEETENTAKNPAEQSMSVDDNSVQETNEAGTEMEVNNEIQGQVESQQDLSSSQPEQVVSAPEVVEISAPAEEVTQSHPVAEDVKPEPEADTLQRKSSKKEKKKKKAKLAQETSREDDADKLTATDAPTTAEIELLTDLLPAADVPEDWSTPMDVEPASQEKAQASDARDVDRSIEETRNDDVGALARSETGHAHNSENVGAADRDLQDVPAEWSEEGAIQDLVDDTNQNKRASSAWDNTDEEKASFSAPDSDKMPDQLARENISEDAVPTEVADDATFAPAEAELSRDVPVEEAASSAFEPVSKGKKTKENKKKNSSAFDRDLHAEAATLAVEEENVKGSSAEKPVDDMLEAAPDSKEISPEQPTAKPGDALNTTEELQTNKRGKKNKKSKKSISACEDPEPESTTADQFAPTEAELVEDVLDRDMPDAPQAELDSDKMMVDRTSLEENPPDTSVEQSIAEEPSKKKSKKSKKKRSSAITWEEAEAEPASGLTTNNADTRLADESNPTDILETTESTTRDLPESSASRETTEETEFVEAPSRKGSKKVKKGKKAKPTALAWEDPEPETTSNEKAITTEDMQVDVPEKYPFNDMQGNDDNEFAPIDRRATEDLPHWGFNREQTDPPEQARLEEKHKFDEADTPKRTPSRTKSPGIAAKLAMFETAAPAVAEGLHRTKTVRMKHGPHHGETPSTPVREERTESGPAYDLGAPSPDRGTVRSPELPSFAKSGYMTPAREIEREPSPINSTSKERSSTALFSSSPSIRDTPGQSRHRHHRSIEEISRGEDFASMRSPPATPGFDNRQGTPLMTVTEQSPEEQVARRLRRDLPEQSKPEPALRPFKRRSAYGLAEHRADTRSPVQEHDRARRLGHISGDDLHHRYEEDGAGSYEPTRTPSGHHDRPRSIVAATDLDPSFRPISTASVRSTDSISAIIKERPTSASPSLRHEKRSVNGELRKMARDSPKPEQSREADMSMDMKRNEQESEAGLGGDDLAALGLAGVGLAATAAHFAGPSTYDPATDKGKGRITRMTDVYGWGDQPGSPRSPSRPPSVRRRQSLQILDLEGRLDSLVSENRLLIESKAKAERELESTSQEHSYTLVAQQESIKTRDLYLQQKDQELEAIRNLVNSLQGEVARLTEANRELTDSKAGEGEIAEQYRLLQAEHAQTRQLHEDSSRELTDMREKHSSMSRGMEGIVAAEVATAVASKDAELRELRSELETAQNNIRVLQQQILASRNASAGDDILTIRDADYFDTKCQQLCGHVQGWVLRFSKFSDTKKCRSVSEIRDETIADRFENAILDGFEVDELLIDRVRRRDIFMSVVMKMIFDYVFTRYLFGMDREQRQKLKALEKTLSDVGKPAAVSKWRATTLTLLSRRNQFRAQREQDTEAVVQAIFDTLAAILPPPPQLVSQVTNNLTKVLNLAVDLHIEMRTQRAEFVMRPPYLPEYDTNGDLARTVPFNPDDMNERSGKFTDNDEVPEGSLVRIVLFPLVERIGDENGQGKTPEVVCPAQVLIARDDDKRGKRAISEMPDAMKSKMSIAPSIAPSIVPSTFGGPSEGGMF